MYETDSQATYRNSTMEYRENWTTGGMVAYLLAVPALVTLMAAPAVAFGVVLGVVGLKFGERLARRLSPPDGGGLSPLEGESGRPA